MGHASPPTLTFVVICFNAGGLIETTLDRLCTAIDRADWPGIDVLVVDDGSTDDTVERVRAFAAGTGVPITVHSQTNQGRLAASRAGVEAARGELVSFIGERVLMHPDALVRLAGLLAEHPAAKVWNCHIDIPRDDNRQAQFWYVLTYLGWRRYLADPRLVTFGPEDFDYYPKGTGGFICPRDLLLEGYDALASVYEDEKNASDDTALIRWIAERERIWMSPEYSADYISRSDMSAFVRHSYQRGTLLLDSYLHPGTRLQKPLIGYFLVSPLALLAVIRRPRLLLAAPLTLLAVSLGLRRAGVPKRDVEGFAVLAPVFGAVFSAGMWRGLTVIARQWWRSRRSAGA
ncbi:MAG TPA: glycosyltransferase family 2 protein [Nocardioides sp.]